MTNDFQQPSMGKSIGVFVMVLVLANAILFAVGYMFPNFPVPGSVGLIVTVVGAMMAGQSWFRQSGRLPTSGEKFTFAFLATALSLALAGGLVWAVFVYYGVPFSMDNAMLVLTGDPSAASDLAGYLPVILAIAVGITLLVTYFGLGSGAKGLLKKQEKQAAALR